MKLFFPIYKNIFVSNTFDEKEIFLIRKSIEITRSATRNLENNEYIFIINNTDSFFIKKYLKEIYYDRRSKGMYYEGGSALRYIDNDLKIYVIYISKNPFFNNIIRIKEQVYHLINRYIHVFIHEMFHNLLSEYLNLLDINYLPIVNELFFRKIFGFKDIDYGKLNELEKYYGYFNRETITDFFSILTSIVLLLINEFRIDEIENILISHRYIFNKENMFNNFDDNKFLVEYLLENIKIKTKDICYLIGLSLAPIYFDRFLKNSLENATERIKGLVNDLNSVVNDAIKYYNIDLSKRKIGEVDTKKLYDKLMNLVE
ncbi:hypothetical protein [Nanobdella aerobiophila]|nr:hypothetical protein [Nanobdella aerobiophila]